MRVRPTWSAQRASGHSGLQSETISEAQISNQHEWPVNMVSVTTE